MLVLTSHSSARPDRTGQHSRLTVAQSNDRKTPLDWCGRHRAQVSERQSLRQPRLARQLWSVHWPIPVAAPPGSAQQGPPSCDFVACRSSDAGHHAAAMGLSCRCPKHTAHSTDADITLPSHTHAGGVACPSAGSRTQQKGGRHKFNFCLMCRAERCAVRI